LAWRALPYCSCNNPSPGAYGIKISCEIYAGFEETIYSVAKDGRKTGSGYDGAVYIKKAETSALLNAYVENDPIGREPRHFLFVGGDFCFEVLGFDKPTILAFKDKEEAYGWGPPREDDDEFFPKHPNYLKVDWKKFWEDR
jgi:hypothetical protein